jgi:hypothetical protein
MYFASSITPENFSFTLGCSFSNSKKAYPFKGMSEICPNIYPYIQREMNGKYNMKSHST